MKIKGIERHDIYNNYWWACNNFDYKRLDITSKILTRKASTVDNLPKMIEDFIINNKLVNYCIHYRKSWDILSIMYHD